MKKMLFNLSVVVLLTLFASSVYAQDYCMWVVNNRVDELNELKVKETTASVFSEDLLPSTTITQGTPFWIRVTDWSSSLGDVQFTDMNGSPLMFTLNTTSGGTADFPYIRINIESTPKSDLYIK